MKLQYTQPDTPIDEYSIALHDEFAGFGHAKSTESHTAKIASYATDETDVIVAGIFGYIAFNTLFIDGLWVNAPLRNNGVGSRLLHLFEDFAYRRRITGIQVQTTDVKVSEFYRRKGYVNCDWGVGNEADIYRLKKFVTLKPSALPRH